MKKIYLLSFLILFSPLVSAATDYTSDANCVGAFKMEGTGTETDVSAAADNVTVSSGDTIDQSSDKKFNSYSRDIESGDTEWFEHADGNGTDISGANQSISITWWLKMESDTGSQQWVVDKGNQSYGAPFFDNQYFSGYDATNNAFNFCLTGDGQNLTCATGATDTSPGTWAHFAGVSNDTDIRIYYNGSLDSNGSNNPKSYTAGLWTGVCPRCCQWSPCDFRIGARRDGGADTQFVDGLIDDVCIFNRALTSTEVSDIYTYGCDGAGGGASSAVKSVNGLAKASVKEANSLANASVKTWRGLA